MKVARLFSIGICPITAIIMTLVFPGWEGLAFGAGALCGMLSMILFQINKEGEKK